jgi:chromosome segregation ATPase
MDEVQEFIARNKHQYGYIMQEASRQWIKENHTGALTVGPCNIFIEKYGEYHEILDSLQNHRKGFSEYANTLNETRRKRDEVKGKLETALKTIKEQRQEIKFLQNELKKFGY